jgi:hypothetical protein
LDGVIEFDICFADRCGDTKVNPMNKTRNRANLKGPVIEISNIFSTKICERWDAYSAINRAKKRAR